jgi:ABC-type transport system involved in multi-copper enzyme maturation permease subunit
MKFLKTLFCEFYKLKRSKAVWATALVYVFIAAVLWFTLWMARNPEAARSLGILGKKADILSSGISADWSGLFTLLLEMSVMGGMILYAIVVAYVFGREYAEGTAKNMLGLPIARGSFVAAKLAVAAAWYALLTAFLLAEGLLVGAALGMGPLPGAVLQKAAGDLAVAFLLTTALQPLVALATVGSSGYLAPFGYAIATMILGNIMMRTEWARWCPWSIVALLSGMTGPRQAGIMAGSALVMAATFVLGLAGTVLHQARADNCQ